jgi:hypothetical protein
MGWDNPTAGSNSHEGVEPIQGFERFAVSHHSPTFWVNPLVFPRMLFTKFHHDAHPL